MATRAKCPNCDQPLATEADHDTRGCDRCARFDATCPHASLCWSAFAMTCPPVDWRARALAAERERDEARRLLADAARGKLRRCETCGERLATRRWRGTSVDVCDRCFAEDKRDAADAWETLDEEACEDLPHAAALRAAMEVAK